MLDEIHRCSRRFIWGIEYFAPRYTEIRYRDHRNLLWKADFAALYLDRFSDLKLIKKERLSYLDGDNEDEMFFVVEGTLDVHEKAETVTLHSGEFCIVPRGIEHRVVPRGHVKLILFEPAGIAHTGNVKAEITKDRYDRLDS